MVSSTLTLATFKLNFDDDWPFKVVIDPPMVCVPATRWTLCEGSMGMPYNLINHLSLAAALAGPGLRVGKSISAQYMWEALIAIVITEVQKCQSVEHMLTTHGRRPDLRWLGTS